MPIGDLYRLLADPGLEAVRPGRRMRFVCVPKDPAYPQPKDVSWCLSGPGGEQRFPRSEDNQGINTNPSDEGAYEVRCRFRVAGAHVELTHQFRVLQPPPGRLRDGLRILVDPPVTLVVPNQRMTFRLEQTAPIEGVDRLMSLRPQWFCFNDMEHADFLTSVFDAELIRGDRGVEWRNAQWDFQGEHRIVCSVAYRGQRHNLELPVTVVAPETMAQTAPIVSAHPNDPYVALRTGLSAYNTIREIETARPPPAEKRAAYEERMLSQYDYLTRLQTLLQSSETDTRIPVSAVYYSHYNPRFEDSGSQWMPLNVFVSRNSSGQWRLVDWTNPSNERLQGDYDGWAADRYMSISEAISGWESHNRYPEGIIRYRYFEGLDGPISPNTPGRTDSPAAIQASRLTEVRDDFETDGSSATDEVSSVLDYIAIGAAVVAGVATLIAPVPGSRVASAAIWTSIFTSTAAATINIAQRADTGFGTWRNSAFDVLTIASNLFAAGALGRIWVRGATLTVRNAATVQRMVLVGQFTTDGVQGVMIAVDAYDQYQQIIDDETLAPDERFHRLATWVARTGVDGLLVVINLRGTRADLDNIARPNERLPPDTTPEQRFRMLQDAGEELTLDPTRPVEGTTSDGVHRTTAQTAPRRIPGGRLSADDLARRLDDGVQDAIRQEAAVGSRRRSPAIAVVVDKQTGEVFTGRNKGPVGATMEGWVPEDLDETLLRRREAALADTQWWDSRRKFTDGGFIDGDEITFGQHAEVWAINDALKARRARGLPVTEETLSELLMDVRRTRAYEGGAVGDHFRRCADCSRLTRGVDLVDALRQQETTHP